VITSSTQRCMHGLLAGLVQLTALSRLRADADRTAPKWLERDPLSLVSPSKEGRAESTSLEAAMPVPHRGKRASR